VASIQVGVLAGNGADRQALSTISRSRGRSRPCGAGTGRRARSRDPGPRAVTERAYAHDWPTSGILPPPWPSVAAKRSPQTLALYLKALETQWKRSPAGLAVATFGLSLPTLRRRPGAIASRHATSRSQQCQHLYLG